MHRILLALALGLLASAATAQQGTAVPTAAEARAMYKQIGLGGLEGEDLARAIAEAQRYPLGSIQNPIRVDMQRGERAYLSRLRCADGAVPDFARSGRTGVGLYGYVLDVYTITCAGKKPVQIYMDMHHDQPETKPVPGFTIAAN